MNKAKVTSKILHMAVLIPARDEEVLLPRCLRAVQKARLALGVRVSTDVIVVSDHSTDRTLHIARSTLGDPGLALEAGGNGVGAARALAADVALQRAKVSAHHCWLANTDADTEVPEDWLLDQLRLANDGCDAVAGIVDVLDFSDHPPAVASLFRHSYAIHSDGTHPHIHGANLGLRGDVYRKAGGWKPLLTAEDHDLWLRVAAGGFCCVKDARLRVVTSGRLEGRAPSGFAGALAAHDVTAATL